MEETDVVLLVGGERFCCHRSVLEEASPYFRAMFRSDMIEKTADEVMIGDAEPDVFRILIDFAYQRKVEINGDNVISLTQASNLFQFEEIQQRCCQFLSKNLDLTNCVRLLTLADFLNMDSLRAQVRSFIVAEFSTLDKDDLSGLSLPLLFDLLSCNYLNCPDETQVFETIVGWTDSNGDDGIVDLLSCIRFKSINPDQMTYIQNHRLIRENSSARDFLCLVESNCPCYRNGLSDWMKRLAQTAAENPPRKNVLPLLVGRWTPGLTETEDVSPMKRREKEGAPCLLIWTGSEFRELNHPFGINGEYPKCWKHFYNKNTPVYGYVACQVGNDLYCFAGEHIIGSGHWNRTIWKCNLRDYIWNDVGIVENPRRHCLIAALDKQVYFIGGYGKFRKRLTTVESYDTTNGTWQNKSDVPTPIYSSVAVTFNNCIYVFSTPIYCYEPVRDEWREVCYWKECSFSAAFVFRDKLYAVTRQDVARLLSFTLPDFEFHQEFEFPSSINSGCLCHNVFYGFNENLVVGYDIQKRTYQIKETNGQLSSEMCCSIPNFKSVS